MLSILIPTTVKRVGTYCPDLVRYINNQIVACGAEKRIDLFWLGDNYNMTVGEKRNKLLGLANRKYLVFIDDDDCVDKDYVKEIMKATMKTDSDVIVFDCITRADGKNRTLSKYGKDFFPYQQYVDDKGERQWRGLVAHTMVWKTEIAKRHMFPEKNYEEDIEWAKKANADISTEYRIEKVLYFYRFNSQVSETRYGQ